MGFLFLPVGRIEDANTSIIEGFCLDITENIEAQKEAELQRAQLIHADKMISIGVLTAGVPTK